MRVLRALLGAVGLSILGGAVALVLAPSLAGSIPVAALLELAGNDYVLVAVVAAAMLLATLLAVTVRGITGIDQATPPDPEEVQSAPRPGEAFDEAVAGLPTFDLPWTDDDRTAIRDRLYEAAVGVEMRRANVSRAVARTAVDRGDWTDDRVAAAFLSAEDGPGPGAGERLRAALRGESWFQRGARLTAREVARIHEGGRPRDDADPDVVDDPVESGTGATGQSGEPGQRAAASGVPDGGKPMGRDGGRPGDSDGGRSMDRNGDAGARSGTGDEKGGDRR